MAIINKIIVIIIGADGAILLIRDCIYKKEAIKFHIAENHDLSHLQVCQSLLQVDLPQTL